MLILFDDRVVMSIEFKEQLSQKDTIKKELADLKSEIESKEKISDEQLFKNAVAKSLKPINKLTDIPIGWIPLLYENLPKSNLPKTMDIFPKEMKAEHLPYTIIQLGDKMFKVTPHIIGKNFEVDDISMDKEKFYVVVSQGSIIGDIMHKTVSKTKDKEMWVYLYKLYTQWVHGDYPWSTVVEIPKINQKKFLADFNKLNHTD